MTQQPWQPLSARLAGTPAVRTLHEGVPPHLSAPLRNWIHKALLGDGGTEVLLRLKWEGLEEPQEFSEFSEGMSYSEVLSAQVWSEQELLDIVDAILAVGGPWPNATESSVIKGLTCC